MHEFDTIDLVHGKWYLVHSEDKPRALKFIGEKGDGHFRTRCDFDYWCDVSKIASGPYRDVAQADAAQLNPKKRKRRRRYD